MSTKLKELTLLSDAQLLASFLTVEIVYIMSAVPMCPKRENTKK